MKEKIITLYQLYLNNFLNIKEFANYLEVDTDKAIRIIDIGRKLNHYNWTNKHLKL